MSILGLLCYGLSFVCFMGVISNFNLGYIVPLLGGIVNVLIVCSALLVLREQLTINMILGAAIIIFGIFVMNVKG